MIYIAVIFLFPVLRALVQQNGMKKAGEAAVVAMLSIYSIIFEKMRTMDLRALSRVNVGDLSNNITNDIMRTIIAIYTGHQMLVSPVLICVFITILVVEIGPYSLAGLLIIILIMGVNVCLSRVTARLSGEKLKLNGFRNKEINFSIGGVKTLKFNGWEQITKDLIQGIRQRERKVISKLIFINCITNVLSTVLPTMAGFVCITLYNGLSADQLKIGNIFFIITIFNLLVTPLRVFVFGLMTYAQARVSLKRISKMLALPDVEDEPDKFYLDNPNVRQGEVVFERASFSYSDRVFDARVDAKIAKLVGKPAANAPKGTSRNPEPVC